MSAAVAGPVDVLDVTLRDGGYLNGHRWTTERVVGVLRSLGAAGLRSAEVGYLGPEPAGAARHRFRCDTRSLDTIARLVPDGPALVVMVKPAHRRPAQVAALARHHVGMVRFPVSPAALASVAAHCRAARDAGLAVAVNLTRSSEWSPAALTDAAGTAAGFGASVVYLADSNGSMFPDAVHRAFEAVAAGTDVPLGFHPHDNLRLAFANALAAMAAGARLLDASVAGIGKGGGNLGTELVCMYLHDRAGAPFDVNALEAARRLVAPERRLLDAQGLDPMVAGVRDLNLDDVERLTAGGERLLPQLDGLGPLATAARKEALP